MNPAKSSELSLEEKRDLVHEISRWADNAPEILQNFSRRDLVQLICAELGKERKYSGVTKPKMIKHLLRLVAEKNGKIDDIADLSPDSLKNQNGIKKKRKKEILLQFTNDVAPARSQISKTEQADIVICQNLACRATSTPGDKYCKRCSCCIR